jgi:hypothetical protein
VTHLITSGGLLQYHCPKAIFLESIGLSSLGLPPVSIDL